MSGYRHIIYVIVSILLLNASNLFAKVYWLPDYLGDNTNRSNGLEDNPQNGVVDKERGCPNGWLDAAQKGDMVCDLMGNYPWVGYCYSNCKCNPDKYLYTEENCSGTKAPTGSSCDDGSGTIYYNQCIDACDTVEGVTNCPYGCKTTYEAEGCPTECKECYTDNCHNRTSVEPCDYGCESYFSDCSSKCEKCYADNCRNRTDNATDLGCDSYWQDCASKCEVGKTCVPTDCSAYTLTSCPANATCTTCTVGCGDSSVKYKISKCNTGYTLSGTSCVCAPKDCSSYKITSSSACPANSKCSSCTIGCGNNTTTYKVTGCSIGYMLKDGSCQPISNAIAFVLSVTSASGGITIYTGTSKSFTIDWGDGSVQNYTNTSSPAHTYSKIGEYQIIITGNSPYFYVSTLTNSYPTQILSVDLDTLLYVGKNSATPAFKDCSKVTGTIPNKFSPNLNKGYAMYYGCKGLTGNIPELPTTLKLAADMFYNCSSLTGNIPNLPSSLTDVYEMFAGCSSLSGNIPTIPTQLTDTRNMFSGCSGLTGFADDFKLPSGLAQAEGMFEDCSGLIGTIPVLPPTLTDADHMFGGCAKLSGTIPTLPTALKSGFGMFSGCKGLTGKIPDLPSSLTGTQYMFSACSGLTELPDNFGAITDGNGMFQNCTGLTGKVPNLPSTLTRSDYMFAYCTGLTEGPDDWGGITRAEYMFSDCTGLRYLPTLPTNLQDATRMFEGCKNLQSPLPELPASITVFKYAFKSCSSLTGTTPTIPSGITHPAYATGAFSGTQLVNDGSWSDSAWY